MAGRGRIPAAAPALVRLSGPLTGARSAIKIALPPPSKKKKRNIHIYMYIYIDVHVYNNRARKARGRGKRSLSPAVLSAAPRCARCAGADARASRSSQPGDFFFNFNSLINTFRAIKSPRLPFIAPGVYFQIESLPLHCTDKYRQGEQRPRIGAGSERRFSGRSRGAPPAADGRARLPLAPP